MSYPHIELVCTFCKTSFQRLLHDHQGMIRKTNGLYRPVCSKECQYKQQATTILMNCEQCNKQFKKHPNQIKKTKHNFCSRSCSCTYTNQHKTTGIRRSKLEQWIETQLPPLYPNLDIQFNRKDTINSELDIYIPSLRLAIELNGIFHYEPIYGAEKLASIQNNDERKFQACLERGIELLIIDTSSHTRSGDKRTYKPYLDIITNLLRQKMDCHKS